MASHTSRQADDSSKEEQRPKLQQSHTRYVSISLFILSSLLTCSQPVAWHQPSWSLGNLQEGLLQTALPHPAKLDWVAADWAQTSACAALWSPVILTVD